MKLNRRDTLKLIAAASVGTAIPGCTQQTLDRASDRLAAIGTKALVDREPVVLTAHEYQTVQVLVDYIIPADDRSGSATDAGVPAFIDFVLEDTMEESPSVTTSFRGGLALLDRECTSRFGGRFVELAADQQTAMLDQIAYPDDVRPEFERAARFFTQLRDLTASGFFSSKMGVEDLGYVGNMGHPSWDGCPAEALDRLGVSYEA